MPFSKTLAIISISALALGACARDGDLDSSGGILVTRSACPAVAIPAYTGDVTVFDPPASRDATAIDVVANITNLKTVCADQAENVVATVSFDVQARRNNAGPAREVTLPYFATVIQGGRVVVSKSVSRVTLRFADGQVRASTTGTASGYVNRAAATLPKEVTDRINRKRKAGDIDAASDPLADPQVKAAVARASFELLIGFQLTQDQLQYNATR